MSGLRYFFIASALITTTLALVYPGFEEMALDDKFKPCEGYSTNNFDASGVSVKLGIYEEDYDVKGSFKLLKSYDYPLNVLVSLIRPNEPPVEAFRTNNYCSVMGNRESYGIDLYGHMLFDLTAQNNYHCLMDPGTYYTDHHLHDYPIHLISQYIDKKAKLRLEFGNDKDACIELGITRTNGTRPDPSPKRKAGSPPPKPAQEGKPSGLQKILKFLKGIFSK